MKIYVHIPTFQYCFTKKNTKNKWWTVVPLLIKFNIEFRNFLNFVYLNQLINNVLFKANKEEIEAAHNKFNWFTTFEDFSFSLSNIVKKEIWCWISSINDLFPYFLIPLAFLQSYSRPFRLIYHIYSSTLQQKDRRGNL